MLPYICNVVEKIRLKLTRTYRPFIAVILLAVYAFVAAPTQLWHHHAINSTITTSASDSKAIKIVKAHADNSAENCAVCSHKYSVYTYTILIPELGDHHSFPEKNTTDLVNIPASPSFILPNKGPPALS